MGVDINKKELAQDSPIRVWRKSGQRHKQERIGTKNTNKVWRKSGRRYKQERIGTKKQ